MQKEQYSFERYLNVRSAFAPSFSHDGKRLSFLTNITGVAEVWSVPIDIHAKTPAWPDQITFRSERVSGASYSPYVLYRRLITASLALARATVEQSMRTGGGFSLLAEIAGMTAWLAMDRGEPEIARKRYVEAIQRAEELSMKSSDRSVRLSVAITGASIRAAGGETAKSLKDLEQVIREARNGRLIQLELEARLALAAVEVAAGRFQAGRLRLEALETEALKKGYKYIADRAASARRKIPAITA